MSDNAIENLDNSINFISVPKNVGSFQDVNLSEHVNSIDPLDMHLQQPDNCKQVAMKRISDHISKWEKHLVYDDEHYERINEQYSHLQKQLFHQAIQRGQQNTRQFVYRPSVPALYFSQ